MVILKTKLNFSFLGRTLQSRLKHFPIQYDLPKNYQWKVSF